MVKTNNPHPVTVILRDWSKAKKANAPIAEMHTKETKKKMTTKEKIAMAKNILQANKEYEEAKRLLYVQYAERFENLPVSECGEVDADSVLALNEWAENEKKRIIKEWTNKVVHA